ncbi:olfactory receptor 51B5-like [Hippopotamus amphibius kiboko]|uniref:olfactory receptor 51B5-like n=1 Tax=Hippopotamus amphibius kiboko TaxID=575201 RepID=UPI002593B7F7|nr:olfactory receptor 51B5-like [Hippopotamus amphibius kiboko]
MWPNSSFNSFLLTGFPDSEAAHSWISTPFFFVYLSVLLGNGTLLLLIKEDHSLHEPMYYFLAMLAATDLGLTLTTMPLVLGVLWLGHREIGNVACFSQAYFIHSLSFVESGVLLAMAYDRFIAIRNPLRYTSILTNARVVKIGLGVLMRGFVSVVPPILPLYFFPYCHSHALSHAFCLHQDVIKLACADTSFNRLYPVVLVVLIFVLDSLIILISYVLILKSVLNIASREERVKALNTCVSHICCVLVFYVTVIGLSLIHRFGKQVPRVVHLVMSYVYFLFPPFMNPIIYSAKTKQIQSGILRLFTTHRVGA